MSPRDSFWFLAGVLVSVAIMLSVRAWLRARPALAGRFALPSFAVPIGAALALIGVALGVYFLLGSPDSITASPHAAASADSSQPMQMGQSSAAAGSLDDVTNKLAARLAGSGGTDSEWKLLAESYEYMGRTAEAKNARAHIASAAPTAAGDATADEAAPVTSEQMAAIADALDKPSAATPATGGHDSGNTLGAPPQGAGSAPGSGQAEISGTVDIASKFAAQAAGGATLFIYAKQPDAPGPPLAVLRVRAEHWPVTFTLNDANAMVSGRNLSSADSVQIEARISKTGDALPQSGDLVGSVASVNPRAGHPVKISIDRQIG